MTCLAFLFLSVSLSVVAGTGSLVLAAKREAAIRISGYGGLAAGATGAIAGGLALLGRGATFDVASPFPFARFVLRLDAFSGLLVMTIGALSCAASVYSLAYVDREYSGRSAALTGFFFNLFIAAMELVVGAENAFWFLVFFELMTLTSYFLVVIDEEKDSISAGLLYFVIAHAGSVAIMVSFFLLAGAAGGSLDFSQFRLATPSPFIASLAFALATVGFGAKAAIVPLHAWLPRAHPAAPSHASALMSGTMVKIGVFGIVKVGADFLHASSIWWGLSLVGLGAVSCVFGVIDALPERDIKRLLAYSTVENVGIIMMGMGVGMVGLASRSPMISALGFLAGTYHLVNHAAFKGLLFMGAGAVLTGAKTRDIRKLGGIGRAMPWTAACFFVGVLSICAIPPLSGFVSEWYTYQGLVGMGEMAGGFAAMFGPLAAVALSLAGALALMCFVKAFGEIFSGVPRSPDAESAREVPPAMVAGMIFLAAASVVLGIASPWLVPVFGHSATSLGKAPSSIFADGAALLDGKPAGTRVSPPLITVLLIGTCVVPLMLSRAFRRTRAAPRRAGEPWASGYLPDADMTVSAAAFVQPVRRFYRYLYLARWLGDRIKSLGIAVFGRTCRIAARAEPFLERILVRRAIRIVDRTGSDMQTIQRGSLGLHCLYIVGALLFVLVMAVA